MLKLSGDSTCQPLEIIFKAPVRNGRFLLKGIKANVVPIHKKNGKQTIKNYCSVLLPHIFGKIFDHLFYNTFFFFLE